MSELNEVLVEGYGFDDEAVILGRPLAPDLQGTLNDHYVQVPLRQLNKHGLIAGATGTGTGRRRDSAGERFVKSAASSVGREVGRSLIRGLLGNLRR